MTERQPALAVVIIGRNEAPRLASSVASVRALDLPVVYADSGSTDNSVAIARDYEVPVVKLDPAAPFSAGRGRNEGLEEAMRRFPGLSYVIFLDADCILDPAFPGAACATFERYPECSIVVGHLAERFPERSIYNRLCDIEWRSPAGDITNMNALGGIMAVRISAFLAVGGFNLQAIAGEEPDLGARLLLAGYRIIKIDEPMAAHDADMTNFGQWWRRAVRGGHALAHRFVTHGGSQVRDGRRELLSDLAWGLALPLLIALLLWPTRGWSVVLLSGYGLLGWRVYRRYRRLGYAQQDSALVSRFIILSKFAHVAGFAIYLRNCLRGEFRIIEWR